MTKTILILEDHAIVAMDLASEIEDAGWSVIGPAGTLDEASALSERQSPSAAILDVNLNGQSSFELAADLRAKGVTVVFVTGYDKTMIPEGLSDCTVLRKPIMMEQLLNLLETAVD